MYFASDNSGPALPEVFDAMAHANSGFAMGYGADAIMEKVTTQIREIFEAPQAAVYLVATGTAANALALATLANPWQTVFCTPEAHINKDECNAPEFFSGGAKLTLVGHGEKMSANELRASIEGENIRGVHGPQRGPVSITQVTEHGTIYSLDELKALCDTAKSYDLPVHLDGARFANAMMALDCTAAEMTWKSGVDVVSFGGTKNGCLGVEAVIFFDPKHAWEFELRRKRGAHLFSKHRYLSAQMNAYLTDDLWRKTAAKANANAAYLAKGLGATNGTSFIYPPQANMLIVAMPRAKLQALRAAGAVFHIWSGDIDGDNPHQLVQARLVCDWSISREDIDQFLAIAAS